MSKSGIKIARGVLFAAVYLVVGIVFLKGDWLGIESVTSRYSSELVNHLFARSYPACGHDKITVALLQESDVAKFGDIWPVSYGTHARVLRALLIYKPAAVLMDFWFKDARHDDTLDELIEVLRAYKAAHIPVYLGTPNPLPDSGIRAELVADDLTSAVGIVKDVDIYDRSNRMYPLLIGNGDSRRPSAALELYLADGGGVRRDGVDCAPALEVASQQPPRRSLEVAPEQDEEFSEPLFVWWGPGGTKPWATELDQRSWRKTLCTRVCRGAEKSWYPNPYSRTVTAYALASSTRSPIYDAMLTNAIVLYGANYNATGDKVSSPTHGPLPGVYLHAMALDNLFTWGADYKRMPESDLVRGADTVSVAFTWIDAIVLPFAALFFGYVATRKQGTADSTHPVRQYVVREACSFAESRVLPLLFVAACGWIGFHCFHLSPINWIGYTAIFEAGHWVLARYEALPRDKVGEGGFTDETQEAGTDDASRTAAHQAAAGRGQQDREVDGK